MLKNNALERIGERGWRNGFANLLRKESRAWWGTRRWLTQSILWMLIVDGFMAFVLFVLPSLVRLDPTVNPEEMDFITIALQSIFQIGTIGLAIGAIILAQDLVIGERQSGVTGWILSKPVSRTAYILSKLVANVAGILVIMVGLPSVVGYGLLTAAAGEPYPLLPYLIGVGGLALHTLFFLTLTLMMGVLVDSRSQVLGVAMGVLFGGQILAGFIDKLARLTPWLLPAILPTAASGATLPLPVSTPLLATAIWSAIFVAVALYKFERLEF